ncbi:MAG TPA: DMT family transporter [Moraxellaceae bacterium]|nr:DMT family transporter [Moraxellaceae bacterium]
MSALPAPSRSGYVLAAATVCIWAGFVLLSRLAGKSALNGNDVVALRFGVAATLLLPAWWWRWRVPLFTARMATLMVFGGMAYTLLAYWSFRFAPAAHGAVLLSGVLPFFVALVSWVVLGQAPTPRVRQALLLIAAGVVCLAIHSLGGLLQSWPGDVMMLCASLCWAVYTVLVRRWGVAPAETTIGVTLLSALCFLPVYVLLLPKGLLVTPWSTLVMQGLYQGVLVAIVAMVLYMQALARLGPLRLGTVMATVPAIAGIGATLVLGEPFSLWLVGGLLLTSAGAWFGTR